MSSVHSMQGVGELLEAFEDKVTITPKGVLGFMSKGIKGTKTIPFKSISAIQFKEAGTIFSGYLQFTIAGGNESKGGVFAAASDENTFMFAEKKNNAMATQIKEYIEARLQALSLPQIIESQSSISLSDELLKLANLRDKGVLSDRGCPKFCVNGQMAGNCRTSRKMNHDRKQRIDRPATCWL